MITRRDSLKASSAATAGAVATVGNTGIASVTDKPRTFVLVHGAWHGGWCWRRVADVLRARGHRVFAPSLTGVGDRAHLFSNSLPAPPPSAFAVTQPADVAWLQRRMRPMPVGTYIQTFTFRNSGSNGLKRTYVALTKPPYALIAPTRDSIKGDPTWSFTTLEAGHDSMVTAPGELASLLMTA
ncbi:MAG: hypothetical protein NT154_00870 [Verrucomicrobia bacterium]|nr:hypothetical protein [Verrucomicrobiota bacterium]